MTTTDTFLPTRMLEIEISQPIAAIAGRDADTGKQYGRAQAVIRIHTYPIGVLDFQLAPEGMAAEAIAAQIWAALSERINAHLKEDGLPAAATLTPAGLVYTDEPACLATRREFLAENPPFFSVLVCTRDRADMLPIALNSLLALDYPNYEIVVIDNAPSDSATADLIRDQFQHPRIRYAREDRPGLSYARNAALHEARGEYIAFTDDDALVDRHWLTEIARGFFAAPNVGCVTGITFAAEIETQAQDWFEQFGGHSKGRGFDGGIFNKSNIKNIVNPVPIYGAGVNMGFATRAIRKVGGFDTALGAGTPARAAEDIFAFLQILQEDYTIVYRPTAFVRHYHRRDYAGLQKQMYNYGVALPAYFMAALFYRPRYFWDMLLMIPQTLNYLANPSSPRTKTMKADYPKELSRAQLRGILYGPWAYLVSRRQKHAQMRQQPPTPNIVNNVSE
jgi:glycosyltransferase involved in cell wall biosynthesis